MLSKRHIPPAGIAKLVASEPAVSGGHLSPAENLPENKVNREAGPKNERGRFMMGFEHQDPAIPEANYSWIKSANTQ